MEGLNAPYTFPPTTPERRWIGTPDTISGWKALADGFLTTRCCAFHRNMEISSRYAWMYELLPGCFKWAAMAAIASHHVRFALYPLRLDTDRTGNAVIPNSLVRRRATLIDDLNTIRSTNTAIFDDIFWVHLAYLSDDDGIDRLRTLLRSEHHYAPVLAGFETIDQGRRHSAGPDRVRGCSNNGRRSHLGRQRPTPRARAARIGATELRSSLRYVRQAHLDRLGHNL